MPTIPPPNSSFPGVEPEWRRIEERIQELEPEIQRMAQRWSRDSPDDWEDLAQEIRLAMYHKLKEDPASPRTHLFQRAKHEILDYRKRGKSVDGKLDRTYHREQVWGLASLDADPEVVGIEYSALYSRAHQLRPVEELALARVAYGELVGKLTGQQALYLALRLRGYAVREVNALMGVTPWGGQRLREEIKRQARKILKEV